jgi:DNA-binding GntR family transcriptional regulator
MIVHETICDRAAEAVRTMIVSGALPDGTRINEVHLAATLGLSRTPLREALNRLAAEGALEAQPRRGYFVKPLTAAEFEQVYAIRPMLDPQALRLAGIPAPARLRELEQLNRKLVAAADPVERARIDDAWHLLLVDACPNRVLIALIEQFMQRTRRYELALFRETQNQTRATKEHERILALLAAGRLDDACLALRENMESGAEPMLAWLRQRERSHVGER